MRLERLAAVVLVGVVPLGPGAAAAPPVHHDLWVRLEPASGRLEASDRLSLPEGSGGEARFVLHAGLGPASGTAGVEVVELPETPDPLEVGVDAYPGRFGGDPPLAAYALRARDGRPLPREVALRWSGVVHHPVGEGGEEYAGAFRETAGTIGPEGAYLAGSTGWIPWLGPGLVTFDLEVVLPAGWDAVSEGARTAHERDASGTRVRWSSPEPLEEVHLVAAPFTVYEDRAGGVSTYAYLREPDEALARRYLDVTAQYLAMYSTLLGPYPFAKFALVENFWETGYGMPSFTLLGPRVIRFPFILHSSYPHEILHNWWGNGVYVDAGTGNWCEGLTAYLADHLVKEQRGEGAAYRRDLLQKYLDYVRAGRDFPLTGFRARHSAATAAVGYGKTAMVFHMLRREVGDGPFVEALRRLYREHRFSRASWYDVRAAFETASGRDLAPFFAQWIDRAGAPALAVRDARAVDDDRRKPALALTIAQDGPGAPYRLRVPVAITIAGRETAEMRTVALDGPEAAVRLELPGRPTHVAVDPDFDLFRRLDRREIPASLGQAFGAERATIVLPSGAAGPLAAAYRALAADWARGGPGEVEVVEDAALPRLPGDRAVWIFGWDNRFLGAAAAALRSYGAALDGDRLVAGGATSPRTARSVVAIAPRPSNPDLAIGFVAANGPAAVPGLARKLPHYGKYGYLAFEGDGPDNVLKGQWDAVGSPLEVELGAASGAPRPERPALAELPPAYSETALRAHVAYLASPELEGRGCGSSGLDRAVTYVEARFRETGLVPAGDDGGFRQSWIAPCGEASTPATLVNVLGAIPGRSDGLRDRPLVVLAHLDHLGLGWPDSRAEDRGRAHPGADDNASGVAVLLELARVLAGSLAPARPVLFVATTGEESGLRGARHLLSTPSSFPASRAVAALNLDTVGRLGDGKLLVLGCGTADEWIHVVRGASYVTGVPAEAVRNDPGGSDQVAFHEAGIPAVQLFTGPHLDYHRPSDTADKIDGAGLVRVAGFAKEIVEYLANREEPLTSRLAGAPPSAAGAGPAPRRASLGTVPDFAYDGPGYRVSEVVPGSPAEAAGLRAGDVVVAIDGAAIGSLREFADVLRGHAPGDRVAVTVRRGDETRELSVTLAQR